MKENILITGATGYIGSNLARHCLSLDFKVSVLVRDENKLSYLEDIKDKIDIFVYDGKIESLENYLKVENIDVVFHLASLYITEHKSSEVNNLIESNIGFGAQVLEAMKNSGVKYLVNTSTTWQHYNNEEYNPVNLYAATKEAFEDILKYYVEKKYVTGITLEIFDTYGEKDNRGKLLNNLYKFGEQQAALAMSEGNQQLDLVFIEDIVNAYIRAFDMLKNEGAIYEKYGLYTGNPISLKNLVRLYEKNKGVNLNIEWGKRPYREREVMNPAYKSKKLPGWSAKMDLEEGIKYIK